ncbi:MAG: ascorbate-dependent monooxygenase [Armatimonadetes bacterium]|nr:ascorbate-dependent monooxygenase [Armatimonadota bacterium]
MSLKIPSLFLTTGLALAGMVSALVGTPVRPAARPAALKAGAVTYAKDIAPILDQKCVTCHRAGEVAPFALTSYADVKSRAAFIAAVTRSRTMPPWKAASHGEFADERQLTDAQIALIQKWSAEGAPLGDPQAVPPTPHFSSGWQLGAPDAEFQPARSYTLAAEGNDVYRCFVVPTHFSEDRWVSAMQVRPGNAKIVHHVIVYLDSKGRGRQLEAETHDGNPGFNGVGFSATGALGGWAPGNEPRLLPPGVGIQLPKGADIVVQVHYHKDGRPETDLTRLGLYFAKGPVDKRLGIYPLAAWLWIPPGDAHYVTHSDLTVPADSTLLEVMPHMHLLGRTMTVTAARPDGTKQSLVNVPDWDFNWQSTYVYKQPVNLPKGTKIHLTATYDNSASNPRNPTSPPKLVTWGEQTTDEMCIAFLFYTVDAEHLSQGHPDPNVVTRF